MLIVFEGIDGSGKTTQVKRLADYLRRRDLPVTVTKWNSSPLTRRAIRWGKKQRRLTSETYFLLHVADMIDRYNWIIHPALERGDVVICDRYWYTSLVRDQLRGIDPDVIRAVYAVMPMPAIIFHLAASIETTCKRLEERSKLSYYGSGMDIGLAKTREESCEIYAELMQQAYRRELKSVPCGAYRFINSESTPRSIARQIRGIILHEMRLRGEEKLAA